MKGEMQMKGKVALCTVTVIAMLTGVAVAGEISYRAFQDGGFSIEVPDWKVAKESTTERVRLKVTRKTTAVQIEVFDVPLESIYGIYRNNTRDSSGFVREDAEAHLLVQKARFLFMKLIIHKKFFAVGPKTYTVMVACKEKDAGMLDALRKHVFDSARIDAHAEAPQGRGKTRVFNLEVDKAFPYGIYLTNPEGTSLERIYKSAHPVKGPKLSHNGEKVVFYEYVRDANGDGTIDERADLAGTEIATIRIDGSGYKVLTDNAARDLQPNWTADNRRIVFVSDRGKDKRRYDMDLYVMDAGGSGVTNLTKTPDIIEADPHVYGGKIAFTRYARGRVPQSIWIMSEDGSVARQLTDPPRTGMSKVGFAFGDFDPRISFDMTRIAFQRLEDDTFKVFDHRVGRYSAHVMNVDGTDLTNVSRAGVSDGLPCWTPDGRIALFVVGGELDSFQKIFIMDADGTNRSKLLHTSPGTFLHGGPTCARTAKGEDIMVFSGRFFLGEEGR